MAWRTAGRFDVSNSLRQASRRQARRCLDAKTRWNAAPPRNNASTFQRRARRRAALSSRRQKLSIELYDG